jgi:hypothetical protein
LHPPINLPNPAPFPINTCTSTHPTGLFFLLDLINAGFGTLEYYNWIRDLANALDAPFDNLINTNYFPLPQVGGEGGGGQGGGEGVLPEAPGGWSREGEGVLCGWHNQGG